MQRDADYFVACADGAVPRAVLGGKNVAAIFGGKLRALIKSELERSIVRLEENVGNDGFVFQFRMLAVVARILMGPDGPPGPTVEPAFLNVSDVVGDEIVAQTVALVDGAPEFTSFGADGQAAAGITDSVSINAHIGAIGVELQNIGAVFFFGCGVGGVDVWLRT